MDSLLDTAPCGFFAFADDGAVVDANHTLAAMLGYTRADITDMHVEKLLPAGGRIFYHTYLLPLLKMRGVADEIFVALRTKGGEEIPVLLNCARREREGRAVNDCILLRMIRRHEYEGQLLQARRLAEESSAAKARFLSMMSHDLRTPLTSIYGNAQLLASMAAAPLSAQQAEAVEAIITAARMQMTLISDILEFARADAGHIRLEIKTLSAVEAIARAEALMRVQFADAGLKLVLPDCPAGLTVKADPNRLQQILLNLMTNAVKFTPAGGEISVWCEGGDQSVRLHVRDTGIGIAPDQIDRIFTPFMQLGAPLSGSKVPLSHPGVGLGLAISRQLARAMGGDVRVESSTGKGSCFTIELPRDDS
jgi:PAS domain S-box-containing protein